MPQHCFSSCLFYAPPPEHPVCSDWSVHTCLSQHLNKWAAVLIQFLCAKLAMRRKLHKCVIVWHSAMSQNHWIKGRTSDKMFQELFSLLLLRTLTFLTFKIFLPFTPWKANRCIQGTFTFTPPVYMTFLRSLYIVYGFQSAFKFLMI